MSATHLGSGSPVSNYSNRKANLKKKKKPNIFPIVDAIYVATIKYEAAVVDVETFEKHTVLKVYILIYQRGR